MPMVPLYWKVKMIHISDNVANTSHGLFKLKGPTKNASSILDGEVHHILDIKKMVGDK